MKGKGNGHTTFKPHKWMFLRLGYDHRKVYQCVYCRREYTTDSGQLKPPQTERCKG